MRILHVITGLQKAAGTTTFVENAVREQRALAHTVDICTVDVERRGGGGQWWLSKSYDVVHLHGLWSALLHRAACFARNHHVPIVWSTHGMTAPWSLHHKWWKKCLPWYLVQKPDLKRAALIHCTTDLEAEWNRALGFENVFVAPLGTNLPEQRDNDSTVHLLSPPPPKQQRTLLYVGRIYPVKALDNAIRAVALMKHPITLRLVGPDQAGHMGELMSLCDRLHLPYSTPQQESANSTAHLLSPPTFSNSPKIQFVGPKYDADLDNEYWSCDGLILVSHTENFGATVVDSLAHSKPVITSTNTPWKIVQGKRTNNSTVQPSTFNFQPDVSGWWIDNDPETLACIFDTFATTSSSDLNLMGQNGRTLVKREYTWPAIANNLISQYERVIRQ